MRTFLRWVEANLFIVLVAIVNGKMHKVAYFICTAKPDLKFFM